MLLLLLSLSLSCFIYKTKDIINYINESVLQKGVKVLLYENYLTKSFFYENMNEKDERQKARLIFA